MKLSPRLQGLASMVDRSSTIVDIGSNHGQLPLYLKKQGHLGELYATEYSDDSYIALQHFLNETSIVCYQANGLHHLPPQVTTVVIAGMGGLLILSILKQLAQHPQVDTLILAPQKDVFSLRKALDDLGFYICEEQMIKDKGHFYPLLKAIKGYQTYSTIELTLGPLLIQQRSPVFIDYLRHVLNRLNQRQRWSEEEYNLKAWIDQYVKD